MYLSHMICSLHPDAIYKTAKPDYASYFEEMHQFTAGFLDRDMLTQKSGYTFSELFHRAIKENAEILPLLQQADVCVLMNTSYEYDSHHSHIGSYLKDRYQMNADLFDIAEQGNLNLVSALHLLSAFFSQQKISRGLIIGFEQRALPLRVNYRQALPKYNGVGLMALFSENTNQDASLKIIEAGVISEKDITEKLCVLAKNNSVHCYLLSCQFDWVVPDFLSCYNVSLIPIYEGILPLLGFFDQLKKTLVTDTSVLHVVLIKDLVTGEWGVVMLRGYFATRDEFESPTK